MNTLFLQLSGPRQSYSLNDRPGLRNSGSEPTKSAVVGMLGACLGMPRNSDFSRLASLRMGVRIDRAGEIGCKPEWVHPSKRSQNGGGQYHDTYYRTNALYLVALQGERDFLLEVAGAIQSPVWAPSLGRANFQPDRPLLVPDYQTWLNMELGSVIDALVHFPSLDEAIQTRERMAVWDDPNGLYQRVDYPISYSPRTLQPRQVAAAMITLGVYSHG